MTRDHGLDSGHHVPGLGGHGTGGKHELCPHILCLLHVAQSQPRYDWSLINLVFIPGHQSINQNQLLLFIDDVTFNEIIMKLLFEQEDFKVLYKIVLTLKTNRVLVCFPSEHFQFSLSLNVHYLLLCFLRVFFYLNQITFNGWRISQGSSIQQLGPGPSDIYENHPIA